ncbi:MAG TPA: hypothetical protein VLE22_03135, partial [Bryobacteraceae bacterium]|nr:hypothetical protein [Bryobacteraceae bacterium]
ETTINDVPVKRYQPGLFETLDAEGKRFAVLLNEDGSYVTRENGAKRGTKVRMFASGLGQTNPALNTNYAGIAGQSVLAKVVIGVNNAGVPVVAAETMPGVVGVYMVTFDLPADTAAGPSRPFAIAIFPEDGGSLIFGNPSEIPVQ